MLDKDQLYKKVIHSRVKIVKIILMVVLPLDGESNFGFSFQGKQSPTRVIKSISFSIWHQGGAAMSKKLYVLFSTLVTLSLIMVACAPAGSPDAPEFNDTQKDNPESDRSSTCDWEELTDQSGETTRRVRIGTAFYWINPDGKISCGSGYLYWNPETGGLEVIGADNSTSEVNSTKEDTENYSTTLEDNSEVATYQEAPKSSPLQEQSPNSNLDEWGKVLGVIPDQEMQTWNRYIKSCTPETAAAKLKIAGGYVMLCKQTDIGSLTLVELGALAVLPDPVPVVDEVALGGVWIVDNATNIAKVVGILVTAEGLLYLEEVLVQYGGHSSWDHGANTPEGQKNIHKVLENIKNAPKDLMGKIPQNGDKIGPLFLCGYAVLQGAAVQYRIFDVLTGVTYFYQGGMWSSAFEGKTFGSFLNGKPWGASEFAFYDPSINEEQLKQCWSILVNAPAQSAVK